jgi:hypothetical protein
MAIKWLVLHPLMQPASHLCRQLNRSSDRVNTYGDPRRDNTGNQTYSICKHIGDIFLYKFKEYLRNHVIDKGIAICVCMYSVYKYIC